MWDQDMVNDDFIGECFVPLTAIQPLRNLASLRDVPVSAVHLKRPYKNIQPKVFEVIKILKDHFLLSNLFYFSYYALVQPSMTRQLLF